MKITDEIVRALQKAINNKGSVDAAAKSTNVKTETLSQFLNRSTNSIRKETWDKLYPLIKPYMPPEKNEDFFFMSVTDMRRDRGSGADVPAGIIRRLRLVSFRGR